MYARNPNPKLEIGFEYSVLYWQHRVQIHLDFFVRYISNKNTTVSCHFVPYSYKEFLITIKMLVAVVL